MALDNLPEKVIRVNPYEEIYKNFLPEFLRTYNIYDLNSMLKRLKQLIEIAGIKTKTEYLSVSFGFHIHVNKQGKAVLYYPAVEGYSMPIFVERKIKNDSGIFEQSLRNKVEKSWLYAQRFFFSDLTSEEKIKNLIGKNIFNQALEAGEYIKFIEEKRPLLDTDFKIVPTNIENLPSRWRNEYYAIVTLESTFINPGFIDEENLGGFKTILFAEPVYIAFSYPIGDIFILITYHPTEEKNWRYYAYLLFENEDLFQLLRNELISLCRLSYLHYIISEFALQSAVAAIMSRNGSHNIGSHILAYLKMDDITKMALRWVKKDGDSNSLEELTNLAEEIVSFVNGQNNADKIEGILKNLTAQSLRWGLAEWVKDTQTFLGYLQHRMDFLAQISTEWPQWTFSAYLMKDIMREFLSQRHLLDGIAKSEGLRGFYYDWENAYNSHLQRIRKVKKEIKVEDYGRIKFHVINLAKIGNQEIKDKWNKAYSNIEDRIKDVKNTDNENTRILLHSTETPEVHIGEGDIQIAIPGGIIGYHAFYVILENVIRNAAKHSYKKKGDLEIVIEFTDDPMAPEENYLFRIYDNVSFVRGEKNYEINHKKYKFNWTKKASNFEYEIKEITNNGEQTIGQGMIDLTAESISLPDGLNVNIKNMIETEIERLKQIWIDKDSRFKRFRVFPEDWEDKEKTAQVDLVAFMNECLRHGMSRETGELDKRHWGMAEMKIAAGYLQRRDILEIGAEGDKITGQESDQEGKTDFIIRAIESPIGTLGFEFRVKKPREVGIVCYNHEGEGK